MKSEQKFLVQKTFGQILPIADTVALIFYQRLFELDPSLRAMFNGDMPAQGRKLMRTLKLAVHNLDRLEEIIPTLQELGRRHADYGVKPEHYAVVAVALLCTLAEGLGDAFTPEVEVAWATVYGRLAGIMQAAAAKIEMKQGVNLEPAYS
jgi:hemoglobin-like flavoprotein